MFSKQVYLDIELIVLWMIICSTSFPTIKHAAIVNVCSTAVVCVAHVGTIHQMIVCVRKNIHLSYRNNFFFFCSMEIMVPLKKCHKA